jgi:hypothetical protein
LKARGARPAREWRGTDVARQIVVVLAVCGALACGAVGSGQFGGPAISDAQGGALDTDASLLAPAGLAFSIWLVIYVGLIAYAVWQALPGQRAASRQRSMGWWIAGTAVLNGLWVLSALYGTLWLTVVVIVLLLAALVATYRRAVLTAHPGSSWLDLLLIDGVTGLHLGWVTLATIANTAALLSVLEVWNAGDEVWAAVVLVSLLVVGLAVSGFSGWRVAPPWAMAWGALWIGVERLAGEPASVLVGWTGIGVAAALFAVPLVLRMAVALRSGD